MKINVTQPILGYDDKPIQNEGKDLTIRTVLLTALNAPIPGSAEDKLRYFDLSMRIYKEDILDISLEDIVHIKTQVAKSFTPIVCGRLFFLFDQQTPSV